MMTREQFAFEEMDARAIEDARFPTAPSVSSTDWIEYAQMRRNRAQRRKAMGYSRATANALVEWARARENA